MDDAKIIKLQELKFLMEQSDELFSLATDLEEYFFGVRTGCKCQYYVVLAQLNNYWNPHGEKELEFLISQQK